MEAEELEDWWKREGVAGDIHSYLRDKEKTLPPYFCSSPQLGSRRYLVDWLAILAQMHDLCDRSQHLAVMLLDFFMDHHAITEGSLKQVALCCLVVAGIVNYSNIAVFSFCNFSV